MKKEKQNDIEITEENLTNLDIETISELEQMLELQSFTRQNFIAYCKIVQQFASIICSMPLILKTTFRFIKSKKITLSKAA